MAGGAGWRSAAGHAANAGTNTSGAGGLYPSASTLSIAVFDPSTSYQSGTNTNCSAHAVLSRLGITQKVRELDPKLWWPISRQIYADVAKNGKPDRIDTFNGNYGLNRGLAAATFALACVAAIHWKWLVALGLLVLTALYGYRAYRFGVYYGRELFLQFLVLKEADEKRGSSEKARQEI